MAEGTGGTQDQPLHRALGPGTPGDLVLDSAE